MNVVFRATSIAGPLRAPRSKLSRRWGTCGTQVEWHRRKLLSSGFAAGVGNGISRPTGISRLTDVPRIFPVHEAAREGRPDDPGLPVIGCAYLKAVRLRGSGFRASFCSAASPSQAKLCSFGSQKPPRQRLPVFDVKPKPLKEIMRYHDITILL
jgi:hypothetical protein